MLSITGMTLDQFADLMAGLGYKADKAEREKVKPATGHVATPVEDTVNTAETAAEETPGAGPEMEVFYTFTWGGRAARQTGRTQGDKPRAKGKPKKAHGKSQAGGNKPQSYQAKPKKEKQIDPDNPFAAALAGFNKE